MTDQTKFRVRHEGYIIEVQKTDGDHQEFPLKAVGRIDGAKDPDTAIFSPTVQVGGYDQDKLVEYVKVLIDYERS